MRRCCLCNKRELPGNGSFVGVPKDDKRREKWNAVCQMQFTQTSRICLDHFDSSQTIKTGRKTLLLPNAVPVLPTHFYAVSDASLLDNTSIKQESDETRSHDNWIFAPAQTDLHSTRDFQLSDSSSNQNFFSSNTSIKQESDDNCIFTPERTNSQSAKNFQLSNSSFNQKFCSQKRPFDNSKAVTATTQCADVGSAFNKTIAIRTNIKNAANVVLIKRSSPMEKQWTLCKEQETQTDPVIFATESRTLIIKSLETENKELRRELLEANLAISSMKKIFTEGQIKRLKSPGKTEWSWSDISSAISLQAAGPRAYKYMYNKGFPLPHISTLQRWCQKIDLNEGLLTKSFEIMRQQTYETIEEKICVLSFDELKLGETYEGDFLNDMVGKPANYVQVAMACGLTKSWKLPVFHEFDFKMTTEVLNKIITELSNAGFPVVAVVSDTGATSRKLWTDLGVTTDKPWFPHPVNSEEKVFTFVDASHLLKLIRNQFLDTGLVVNKENLKVRTIADVLNHKNKCDTSIKFELNDDHLSVKGEERQKVKLAAQLFSTTTADAIKRFCSQGLDIYKATETAEFIQLVNDWYDLLNSSLDTFGVPGKDPYGISMENQNDKLIRMNQIMSIPIVPNKNTLEHFQKGVLITNNALVMLQEYVKKYDMKYILTHHLNQDPLEHLFDTLRSIGALNETLLPHEFKYRLRKYLFTLNNNENVETNSTKWLNSTNCSLNESVHGADNITVIKEETPEDAEQSLFQSHDEKVLPSLNESDFGDFGFLQEDTIEYEPGYTIQKLDTEEYETQMF